MSYVSEELGVYSWETRYEPIKYARNRERLLTANPIAPASPKSDLCNKIIA